MEKIFQKIENKFDLKSITKKIFILFIILQPILDIYMCLFDGKIQLMGVSIATIFRFFIVGIMVLFTMIYTRKNKATKLFIGYGVLVCIYTVFHHINAVGFSVPLAQAEYSLLGELLYIARMCIPPALIYIIYCIKPNYKDIKKMVLTVSLIISLVVIVTNFLKVGFISYCLDDVVISDNAISWFKEDKSQYTWVQLTSRGFFQASNQLTGVMIILVPIIAYIAWKENKIHNWIILLLHLLVMLNLTTRVGAIGGIAVVVAVSAIYFLEKIIHKEVSFEFLKKKNIYCFMVTLIIYGIVFQYSPFKTRIESGGLMDDVNLTKSSTSETKNTIEINENVDEKIKVIEANWPLASISAYHIIEAYPYTEDADFWYNIIINVPYKERVGNRNIRTLMIRRILERDNRISNYIWGISFTRSSAFVWPERDFETQIDGIGIVGEILFIGPYIFILLLGIFKFFKNFKDNLYLSKVIYLISLVIGLFAAYASGHILNEVFPFIFLAMVTGIVYNMCTGSDPEKIYNKFELRPYFEKLYPYNKERFYNEIKYSLNNNERRFVITANPETFMIANKNKDFEECLLSDEVLVVPDGIGIIKGAKVLGYPQRDTITGVELVQELFAEANKSEKSVYLFGAKEEVVSKLEESIKEKYPKISVVGKENGYVQDRQAVFERIKELKPDLILVALGIPNQELLIKRNFADFDKGIFIGVGGSFDVLSGMKKRAPKFFIKFHLEWLYRITTEPKRLKRFFESNVRYLTKIYDEK